MMGNRHRNHGKRGRREAIAPYNFVPLPDDVFIPDTTVEGTPLWQLHDQYVDECYSGWFDLEIITETPTFIRCGHKPENSEPEDVIENPHRQNFFHHGDPNSPVIPGSSIRGMIRSLVEIVSCSKMTQVQDERFVFRSVASRGSLSRYYRGIFSEIYNAGKKNIRAGYLEKTNHGWAIRPAQEDELGQSFIRIHYDAVDCGKHKPSDEYDRELDIRTAWIRDVDENPIEKRLENPNRVVLANESSTPKGDEWTKGVLVRSGHFYKKKTHYFIFEPDYEEEAISISDEMWNLYEDDRDKTRGFPTRKLEKNEDPLFYMIDEDNASLRFFGPTLMFRIPYEKSVHNHIPDDLKPSGKLDFAEALFGTIRDEYTIKGRLFFEDAIWNQDGRPFYNDNEGRRVPEELSGPKATTFEHYLEQKSNNKHKLKHWDDSGVKIRGHKRYWHKKNNTEKSAFRSKETLRDPSQKDRATVIRPVKPKIHFKTKVHFENLKAIELGALSFVLELPDSMRHNMGMGKPLGMGTIQIIATPHIIERKQRYSNMFESRDLYIGEINQSKPVTESARNKFTKAMLTHYGTHVDNLWSVPRMRSLAAMLEWENAPSPKYTQYMGLKEFGKSKVLPPAEEVQDKYG